MSVTEEYWFARRFPPGSPRNAMAPVHWKGWAATGVFIASLVIGALAFAWMGASGAIVQGAVAFIVASALGTIWFLTIAARTCDQKRTIADYKRGSARA